MASEDLQSKLFSELIWLVGILVGSAVVEYAVITIFDLHPILSVKIQAFIGLVVVAYVIRMLARMGDERLSLFDDKDDDHKKYS